MTVEELDRITINPEVCLGQPTIRGMRIDDCLLYNPILSLRNS